MSTVAKILIVVNLVLAGAFVGSAAAFLGWREHFKAAADEQIDDIQARLDKAVADYQAEEESRKTAENNSARFEGRVEELEGKVTVYSNQAEFVTRAYNEASAQNVTLTEALAHAKETIKNLQTLIETLRTERAEQAEVIREAKEQRTTAVRQLNDKEVQVDALMAQVQQLEARVTDLQAELQSSQMALEALRQRYPGADVAVIQPAHAGTVLDVDADANIAIISLGEEDGVRPGFRYTVSRGSSYVGTLEITAVQARQAAGRSVTDLEKSPIQRGDRVQSR